jgi:hypothetical protein
MKLLWLLSLFVVVSAAISKRQRPQGSVVTCSNNVYSNGLTKDKSSLVEQGLTEDEIGDKVWSMWSSGGKCASRLPPTRECGDGKCESVTQRVENFYLEKNVSYWGYPYRMIVSNGMSDSCSSVGAEHANPNWPCEHFYSMLVPLEPIKGSAMIDWGMGGIGMAINGALIYNHKSAMATCNVAAITEGPTLDMCMGHADKFCHYHYHSAPICMADADSCGHVGYQRDGFPIHGVCSVKMADGTVVDMTSNYYQIAGTSGCDTSHYSWDSTLLTGTLDDANGYTFEQDATSSDGKTKFNKGQYYYFFTTKYPFSQIGYYGSRMWNNRELGANGICEFSLADLEALF